MADSEVELDDDAIDEALDRTNVLYGESNDGSRNSIRSILTNDRYG